MNVDDFEVDGEIKIKVRDVRGANKKSKVWRVLAEGWILKNGEKKFVEKFSEGLRKEEYNLKDKEKLKKRLKVDYKEMLSRNDDFQDYYHDNYVSDEDKVAEDIKGETL